MMTIVRKRTQSVLSCCAMTLLLLVYKVVNNCFKHFAPVFVVLKLVEAGAGRGKQDNLPRFGVRVSVTDGGIQRAGVDQWNTPVQLGGDLAGGRSDQQHSAGFLFQ